MYNEGEILSEHFTEYVDDLREVRINVLRNYPHLVTHSVLPPIGSLQNHFNPIDRQFKWRQSIRCIGIQEK